MNTTRTKVTGFTLIEVLVAMAIMALIGVGALSILNSATKTSDRIKTSGSRLNEVQRAFMFIANDMQQLSVRQVRDEYGERLPAMQSDLQSPTPYIRLTRLGRRNPAQLVRSNLEHLVYTLEDKVLMRTSYTFSDGMVADMGLKRPILKDVESMKMSFYDGQLWHGFWPLTNGSPQGPMLLPVAVKIRLELTDYGIIDRLFAIFR